MRTLLLDIEQWDLAIDAKGDIAVASNPYALAQDAASAIKLFQGEQYYDTTKGVPYWQDILGLYPPLALVKAQFVKAALTVPEVVASRAFIQSFTLREIRGQVHVTDVDGKITTASF